MRKNSIKNIRLNSEVQKELSSIIRDVKDPRVSPWTGIIEVYVAPDLKTCKVWISVLGSEEDRDNTIKGLQSAAGYIRHELAVRMNLRNTPELTFISDTTTEYGVDMIHKIDEVIADDEARHVDSEEDT
ncbi:MAG: 30S ribosome-binding factor RbfA [Lachnospiraceae bacterium]|nr:30S ribosome-binding factor RbfA [Lachnospiraceae bacterium]MBO7531934.1 30S ribosome-binding factor RbfA [Lachnospiraceae bacterium]MBP5252165.1 30S ribosome-binding factor RbfA [Lachnospiraceae bacterium]MBP5701512.1 30S ribosome-binding factor RbfA [Lachnospiraceae bacterium]MBP5762740.1 30S ribosome-binding factor RbfA [Lachnospiraceae bacterium]